MENTKSNLDVAKALYASFARKDISGMLELLHEHVEWGEPENPYNPAGGTRMGHNGFLEWISIGKEEEEILELNILKFLTDNDSVAVFGHMRCKAIKTSKE